MNIEELKQGQAVWVKGFVYRSVFGGCGGFIDFYNQDGNHCGHISRNNVREMKEEDVQIDQPKPEIPQMIFDVIESFDEDVEYLHEHLNHQSDEVREWLTHNERDFYEAWLAYPNITVQKEKLYTVNVLGCTLFKMTSDNHVRYKLIGENETPSESKFSSYKFEADLTEKEIKEADERLWQFAKEVTE